MNFGSAFQFAQPLNPVCRWAAMLAGVTDQGKDFLWVLKLFGQQLFPTHLAFTRSMPKEC
jgi:hypothetical protein